MGVRWTNPSQPRVSPLFVSGGDVGDVLDDEEDVMRGLERGAGRGNFAGKIF